MFRPPADGSRAIIGITGANGFLGRVVVKEMVAAGHAVVGLVRRQDGLPRGCETRLSDDFTRDARALVAGCDAIIHSAARVHTSRKADAINAAALYKTQNVAMATALATAARDEGVGAFVQISSVAAIASHTKSGETITDRTVPRPSTPYGQSKLAADEVLASLANADFSICSLRFPAIYGPQVSAFFAILMKAARIGLPLPVARFHNRRSFIYLDHAASAVLAALQTGIRGAYVVTDSEPVSTAALYRELLKLYGKPDRVWKWPPGLVRPAAKAVLGSRSESFLGDAAFDGTRFRQDTGWEPALSMEQALSHTVIERRQSDTGSLD